MTYKVYTFYVEAEMSPEYMDEMVAEVASGLFTQLDNGEGAGLTVSDHDDCWIGSWEAPA